MAGIFDILGGAIKPVTNLIDNMHTSDEEKQAAKKAIFSMQNTIQEQLIKSKGEIIKEEAKSEHFLTSTWRPITALTFVVIIANNYIIAPYMSAMLGWQIMLEIPPQMWDLLNLMIGGYVASRGAEKLVDKWKEK